MRVPQEASSLAEALQAAQRDAQQAAQQAKEAEKRAGAAEAAVEQLRGQQAQQARLSEELRQALSSNQQLASQVEEASSQSSQVQIFVSSQFFTNPAMLRQGIADAHLRQVSRRDIHARAEVLFCTGMLCSSHSLRRINACEEVCLHRP